MENNLREFGGEELFRKLIRNKLPLVHVNLESLAQVRTTCNFFSEEISRRNSGNAEDL